MWLGFLPGTAAWPLGGTVRVSQVQLLALSEHAGGHPAGGRTAFDATTVGFALAVIATVYLGRRMLRPRPGR